MRKKVKIIYLYLIISFILLNSVIADSHNWSQEILISSDNDIDSVASIIEVSGDDIHILWNEQIFPFYIMYKRSQDGGLTWSDEETMFIQGGGWPDINADGNIVHLVNSQYNFTDGIFYLRSTDNGDSWEEFKEIYKVDPQHYVSTLKLERYLGSLHLVWLLALPNSNKEIYYMRSNDNGNNWEDPVRLTINVADSNDINIAVDENNIHVVWDETRLSGQYLYYTRSTDNGKNWDDAQKLTDQTQSLYSSIIAFNENIHLVWYKVSEVTEEKEIYYKRSFDNGLTWSTDTSFTRDDGLSSFWPIITHNKTTLHVIWIDERDGHSELYFRESTDNGDSWSEDSRITENDGKRSSHPDMVFVDEKLHLAWEDQKNGSKEIYYKNDKSDFRKVNNNDSKNNVGNGDNKDSSKDPNSQNINEEEDEVTKHWLLFLLIITIISIIIAIIIGIYKKKRNSVEIEVFISERNYLKNK
jgi:photosystem II stability/assembly factor-like uncharacterized protein